jgi:hypothetical protein
VAAVPGDVSPTPLKKMPVNTIWQPRLEMCLHYLIMSLPRKG